MLIEFRVENHRSIKDEQVLTMEATPRVGEVDDVRPRSIDGFEKPLLPAAVFYGPNASGKSNLLAALCFMRDAVRWSFREWEPDGGVPRDAFRWGTKRSEDSLYEVTFLLHETKFEYGFSLSDATVTEEWLYCWPNGRKQTWFERVGQDFKLGENLEGPNKASREVTRPNSLFLSAAAQNNHDQLLNVYWWFRQIYPVNLQNTRNAVFASRHFTYEALLRDSRSGFAQQSLFPDFEFEDDDPSIATIAKNQIRDLLKAADLGIVDVRMATEKTARGRVLRRVYFLHEEGNDDAWLPLEDESKGTQTLFGLITPIFYALTGGGLLLVDELESSLHPLLGKSIVEMFNQPASNPKNAQLLFTTHDTNLLGNTLGEAPLRRDQIWFTEKDKSGATSLYPLTDYKPRKGENLERGYLQGRYGAIPFLGDMSWITESTAK